MEIGVSLLKVPGKVPKNKKSNHPSKSSSMNLYWADLKVSPKLGLGKTLDFPKSLVQSYKFQAFLYFFTWILHVTLFPLTVRNKANQGLLYYDPLLKHVT